MAGDKMANDSTQSGVMRVALRFATWMLPPHRKEWAEAMFNEMAYVKSRRVALGWALGCTLFVIRERASYELVRTFMTHKILKTLLGLSAVFVVAVVGVYMMQKPYQRVRILHVVFHRTDAPTSHQTGSVQ